MSLLASANSLARRLDIVCAGWNGEALIWLLLPMTIVMAIVSPAARARPSMIAPNRPLRLYFSISFEDSHQVAPSAVVPSTCARGTARSTSRLIAVMIGRIMIARIRPPLNMSRPVVEFAENHGGAGRCAAAQALRESHAYARPSPQAKATFRPGSTWDWRNGASTNSPHIPYAMLGMAARNSIRNETGATSRRGEIRTRNSAAPRLSGTANTSASAELTTVP